MIPTVTTNNTPAVPEELTMTFLGRPMRVTVPNEDQVAVLIAAQEWFRRQRRRLDVMEPMLAEIPASERAGHALVAEAEQLAHEGIRHVGRFQVILKSLFLDPEDWDEIQDGLADKTLRWQEVSDIPALVLEARNEAATVAAGGTPVNRAGRRAAKKTTSGRLAR